MCYWFHFFSSYYFLKIKVSKKVVFKKIDRERDMNENEFMEFFEKKVDEKLKLMIF